MATAFAEASGSVHPLLYSVTVAACTSNFALLFNLCCTREKQKAENKDRKVLEILQAKDYRIQELEQVLLRALRSSEINLDYTAATGVQTCMWSEKPSSLLFLMSISDCLIDLLG